jgi:polysaccharide export outer membrane protein
MKNNFLKNITVISVFILLTSSCGSKKNVVYLQQGLKEKESIENKQGKGLNYEPVLQVDDILLIVVSAENPEVAIPYNLNIVPLQGSPLSAVSPFSLQSYLIDKDGYIELPILGKIKLGGLTRIEAIQKLKILLEPHLKDSSVNLRILNFKISVIGEVNRPGSFPIQSERITLLEALSLAGDLTIYGNRNSILIIREKEGLKTIEKVDITKRDFISSPYYYLCQNDQIYVEPNKTKINASLIGPDITVGLSALSILITILALTIKFK